LETLQKQNHRDAEAQRTKKRRGIMLPEKKVKNSVSLFLCGSVRQLATGNMQRNHKAHKGDKDRTKGLFGYQELD